MKRIDKTLLVIIVFSVIWVIICCLAYIDGKKAAYKDIYQISNKLFYDSEDNGYTHIGNSNVDSSMYYSGGMKAFDTICNIITGKLK